jgi:hypothetical protein
VQRMAGVLLALADWAPAAGGGVSSGACGVGRLGSVVEGGLGAVGAGFGTVGAVVERGGVGVIVGAGPLKSSLRLLLILSISMSEMAPPSSP